MIQKRKRDLVQILGTILVGCGILYEIIYKAPIGFILITLGSLVFAIGTKIKHRGSKQNE